MAWQSTHQFQAWLEDRRLASEGNGTRTPLCNSLASQPHDPGDAADLNIMG